MKSKIPVEVDESRIDSVFAHLNHCHLPGAAIGVAIDGKPVYRKAFGLANSELSITLSTSIKMRIASITKHFTSLAYLLLCENGKAQIDDSIGRYLPEIHPVSRDVTMRQLMAHVSGIRDASDICWHFSGVGKPVSSRELLSLYKTVDDVNYAPGKNWVYNNSGYQMVSAAIERIANRSFEEVLQETIFGPVGMYDTALRRYDTDFVYNSATLHTPKPDKTFEKSYLGTALTGEGGIVSTVDDMLLWLTHMESPEVGSVETWGALKQAHTLTNGTSTGYGLGLISGRYRGLETLGHTGGVLGGTADMLKAASAALDVVVLTNRGDVLAPQLSRKVVDACLTDDQSEYVPEYRLITGIFRSGTTGRVIQLFVRDGQQIASIDGTDIPVRSVSEGVLYPASTSNALKYSIKVIGRSDAPLRVLFDDFGNRDELSAVSPGNDSSAEPIAGRYRSDSTDTEVTICPTEDGASMRSMGHFGPVEFRLSCVTQGVWRSKSSTSSEPWAGVLTFDRGNSIFRYANLQTRGLHFRRID